MLLIKINGYMSMFSVIFMKQMLHFLIAFPNNDNLLGCGQLLKDRICLEMRKFSPLTEFQTEIADKFFTERIKLPLMCIRPP